MASGCGTTIEAHEPIRAEPTVPKLAALTLTAGLAAVMPLGAQERPPALSTDLTLQDFGLADVDAVRRGRVSVVYAPAGPRLEVHYLSATSAPRRPADGGAAVAGGDASAAPGGADSAPGPSPRPLADRRAASTARPLSALWVWTTETLLADASARADFLALVTARGIDRVFLQIAPGVGLEPSAGYVPFDGAALGPLVAELRARGALTYALDGDPRYALPVNHGGVARTIQRVAEHNRVAPPEQRFHGVRYDVEPYLLPGFQGPRRAEILSGYVALMEVLSLAARQGGLRLGVDIPFWLDSMDEVTGEPFEVVEGGRATPLLGRVLELVDDVGLMAYRTQAGGPDGVLAHTQGELARAPDAGVEVFVGIETTRLADELRHSFRGPGRSGVPDDPTVPWVVLQKRSDGQVRAWLVEGDEGLRALEDAAAPASLTYWFAGDPVPLPGDRLSFFGLGADAMRRTAGEIIDGMRGQAAFRGLAYHDYDGLRALLDPNQ
jgi:hypothetical protein